MAIQGDSTKTNYLDIPITHNTNYSPVLKTGESLVLSSAIVGTTVSRLI